MAVTNDPNDPATVLRNKIKDQVSGGATLGNPNDPPMPLAVQPPAFVPGETANTQGVTDPTTSFLPGDTPAPPAPAPLPKQGITDPTVMSPDPGTPAAPTAPTAPTLSAQDFIKQYQQTHQAGGGIAPLADALKAGGYNVGRYMYGQTASNNELNLDGQKFKVIGAEDSPNTAFWYTGQNEGGGNAAPANPAMPPATSAFTDQIRKMLMERMGRDTAGVNETDSNIAQPFAAANLQAQRGQQNERTALAERLAASGDTSGSLERGIQQSAERNAVGLGSLKAQLIQREYQARRADLNDAMQQALQSGDRETAYQLQTALAQLDAQLRREGYGVNMAEFQQNQNNSAAGAVI